MNNLGWLYHNGWGVPQDYGKARGWYEKAAEKGNDFAMNNLGVIYGNGLGVPQDYGKARGWYEKAADKGNDLAMNNLGWFYQNGWGVPQDYGKARGWYEKAADKGNDLAMNNLGVIYGNGLGVPQDYGKARGWYEKAAGKGNALAETNLNELFIAEAAGAGRYAEALQLQEALAMKKETAETKREGKPGKETAETLTVVVWYALFAREFTKALAIAERVHALFPDDLVIETNRSHALMFLGRSKESRTLYLVHKGKPLSEQDPRKWERAIADDFAEFRKAGLRHPMMSNIEKELGVSR
jgi:Sel1 repeat